MEERRPTLADRVTCWGDGRVNLRRAEIPVLREALAGVLSESDLAKLRALREGPDAPTSAKLVGQLGLQKDKAKALAARTTGRSACYSLWVIAEGPTRLWHRFYVAGAEGEEGTDPQTGRAFLW
jgi:hypothetical protein